MERGFAGPMSLESALLLAAVIGIVGYLVTALILPERF